MRKPDELKHMFNFGLGAGEGKKLDLPHKFVNDRLYDSIHGVWQELFILAEEWIVNDSPRDC